MATEKKIAVAGATGRVGHHVVEILREEGHDVVPMSRNGRRRDSGEGLREALEGVDLIVDAASSPSPEEAAAAEFFTTAARNLHQAGSSGASTDPRRSRSSGPTTSPPATTRRS